MDTEVRDTLEDIVELGHVEIRDGKVITRTPPIQNLCYDTWDRWTPTIQYLEDYVRHHEDFGGEFFVCLYDGWREYSEPAMGGERVYVPWKDVDKGQYIGTGNAREPRFRHMNDNFSIYPELPRKVLTYNRHVDDNNALLIPDSEFIGSHCFQTFTHEVKQHDKPWEAKKDTIVWRGSPNTNEGYLWNSHGIGRMHPRNVACHFSSKMGNILDASFSHAPISWQLEHKYILDIDGMVNAWSALYWKLSSNSLVLKTKTHWEQWYYPLLQPYQHYMPVDTLYELPRIFQWCSYNQEYCKRVTQCATDLVASLTYEYATRVYIIH